MIRASLRLLILATSVAVACATPTSPATSELDGTWVSGPETASPRGFAERSITFGPGDAYRSEVRTYGIYPGQPANELSSYGRIEGTYGVVGDRLTVQPARLVEWDRFYGAASPERVIEPCPYQRMIDDDRFEVRGRQLTLYVTTYPADAAVPTTMVFTRAP